MRIENSPGEQLQALAQIGNMAAQSREAAIKAEQTRIAALSERFRQAQTLGSDTQMRAAANELGSNFQMPGSAMQKIQQYQTNPVQDKSQIMPDLGSIKKISEAKVMPDQQAPDNTIMSDRVRAINDNTFTPEEMAIIKNQSGTVREGSGVGGLKGIGKIATDEAAAQRNNSNLFTKFSPVEKKQFLDKQYSEYDAIRNKQLAEVSQAKSTLAEWNAKISSPEYQQSQRSNATSQVSKRNMGRVEGQLADAYDRYEANYRSDPKRATMMYDREVDAINRRFDIKPMMDSTRFMAMGGGKAPDTENFIVYDEEGNGHTYGVDKNSRNKSGDAKRMFLAENPNSKVGARGITEGSKTNLAGSDEKKAEHLQTLLAGIAPKYNGNVKNFFATFTPFGGLSNSAQEDAFNTSAGIHGVFVENGKIKYYANAPKYTQLAMGDQSKSEKLMPKGLNANPLKKADEY